MYFKSRILKFRAYNKLSRRQAAEVLGVNASMIYRYEKGDVTPHATNEMRMLKAMREYRKEF